MTARAIVLGVVLGLAATASLADPLPAGRLQEIVDAAVADGVPGAVLLVETGSGESWVGAAGVERLGGGAVTPDSAFRIYSTAKMIVAATAFTLIDEGTLGLDDPVGKWLTAEQLGGLPHADAVTIRQLIAQTSGIRDYFDDRFIDMIREDFERVWTPAELIALAAAGDPAAEPGSATSYYSNTNYVLLGLVIEAVSGRPLAAAIRARILEPLAASHTFSWEEAGRSEPIAGYFPLGGELLDLSDVDLSISWSAGGIISTASDLAKITRGILVGPLLSAQSRALMTTNFRPMTGRSIEYGYGTFRAPLAHPMIGHSGEGPGFAVIAMLSPEDGTLVVAMTNLGAEAHVKMLEQVLEAIGP
jgi:D-alanyl-D-alanine carboxypeptidase